MDVPNPQRENVKAQLAFFSLAMNYVPLFYLVSGAVFVWQVETIAARSGVALFWIYLVPPLVGRLTLMIFGYPQGRGVRQNQRAFKVWWFLTQLQAVYNRMPFLEELLRFVPGLYGSWLTLWGSQVSLFAYWSPGSQIVDRYLARVERGAVIGGGASLSSHLSTVAGDGAFVVDIAPITIEEGAVLGARCGIGPGCHIGSQELVTAGRLLPPFTTWRHGRKVKQDGPQDAIGEGGDDNV